MITFRTPGTLDIRAVTTLGVSVKETDSPIGFFGTGLKYAIAILLRHRQTITIHTSGQTYKFAAKPTSIRGQIFEIITMNGQELGFTTALGKTWELWMAYRELICNTLDEGGKVYEGAFLETELEKRLSNIEFTSIVVEGREFLSVHQSRASFLLYEVPHHKTPHGGVICRPSSTIFYRGIAVYKASRPFFYTYNIQQPLTLTEERTAKNNWELDYFISNIIAALPEEIIERVITCGEGYYEGRMSLSGAMLMSDNSALMSAVAKAAKHNSAAINPILAREYEERLQKDISKNTEDFILSDIQRATFERCVAFVEALGFDVSAYPVRFVRRLGANIYGAAHNGQILISQLCFDHGAKMLAGTLIEEFIHLREGLNDNTREFQNYLLNRLVGIGEELKGVSL